MPAREYRMARLSALAVVVLVIEAASANGQTAVQRGSVRGIVSDSSGHPIPSVQVSIVGTDIRTQSRPDGSYLLAGVWPGEQIVRIRRLGFAPDSQHVTVVSADSVSANFTMDVMVPVLDAASVTADPSRG